MSYTPNFFESIIKFAIALRFFSESSFFIISIKNHRSKVAFCMQYMYNWVILSTLFAHIN